jgi:uncharacterized protein (TIGR03067 family)
MPAEEGKGVGASAKPPEKVGFSLRGRLAVAVVAAAVGVAVWYFAIRTPEPRDDLGRFQGDWTLAVPAGTRDARAVRPKPAIVRVTGDRWAYVIDGKVIQRYAITLRPDADPKEIDLAMLGADDRPNGKVIRGVYAIDRDRAKVAHAPDPDPRPTTTDETAPDAAGTVWLLERVP